MQVCKIAFCCSASADYVEKYQKCVLSQETYCKSNSIDYFLDQKSLIPGQDPKREWYWRKVYNIIPYFDSYDYVCIIDIDIEIKDKTPNIRTVIDSVNSIFYVNGISGRPNSGFLIIKSDKVGKQFINTILSRRGNPLPKYASMKGENGYVIEYLKETPFGAKELSIHWNCSDPNFIKEAYFLHYTNKLSNYYIA